MEIIAKYKKLSGKAFSGDVANFLCRSVLALFCTLGALLLPFIALIAASFILSLFPTEFWSKLFGMFLFCIGGAICCGGVLCFLVPFSSLVEDDYHTKDEFVKEFLKFSSASGILLFGGFHVIGFSYMMFMELLPLAR